MFDLLLSLICNFNRHIIQLIEKDLKINQNEANIFDLFFNNKIIQKIYFKQIESGYRKVRNNM